VDDNSSDSSSHTNSATVHMRRGCLGLQSNLAGIGALIRSLVSLRLSESYHDRIIRPPGPSWRWMIIIMNTALIVHKFRTRAHGSRLS
jgi:hypothetical protein